MEERLRLSFQGDLLQRQSVLRLRKSVQKIQINGGTVTAEVKKGKTGAREQQLVSGSSINKKDVSTAQIHITGGKINVYALYGAGIGSGSGVMHRCKPMAE